MQERRGIGRFVEEGVHAVEMSQSIHLLRAGQRRSWCKVNPKVVDDNFCRHWAGPTEDVFTNHYGDINTKRGPQPFSRAGTSERMAIP